MQQWAEIERRRKEVNSPSPFGGVVLLRLGLLQVPLLALLVLVGVASIYRSYFILLPGTRYMVSVWLAFVFVGVYRVFSTYLSFLNTKMTSFHSFMV